jgi:beta-glucosidase
MSNGYMIDGKSIQEILFDLTLEEKANFLGGDGFWNLHGIEHHKIPSIMVTDGPHGLRKMEPGTLDF